MEREARFELKMCIYATSSIDCAFVPLQIRRAIEVDSRTRLPLWRLTYSTRR